MTDLTGIDWADAFENGAYIDGADHFPPDWADKAQAFRADRPTQTLTYGPDPRQIVDLVMPDATPKGLAVFVHGGYWHRFDPSLWTHLAAGALAHGWAVALPGYPLAPQARITQITGHVAAAIDMVARRIDGPIRLAGHSAGGHLVTRMACATSPLPAQTAARLDRIVSISGLHDLRPIQNHPMNDMLALDPPEALAESPALHAGMPHPQITAWVGARERPEFLRQAALLSQAWSTPGRPVPLVAEPDRHHFDVIDGLADPHHPLCRAFAGDGA